MNDVTEGTVTDEVYSVADAHNPAFELTFLMADARALTMELMRSDSLLMRSVAELMRLAAHPMRPLSQHIRSAAECMVPITGARLSGSWRINRLAGIFSFKF